MKKPVSSPSPTDDTEVDTDLSAIDAPALAGLTSTPAVEKAIAPEERSDASDEAPEVMPVAGGSYIRLPDGSLQREEEA